MRRISGNAKSFLRNAILLSLAALAVILMMNEWGVAQVIISLLLVLLAAGQWVLFVYMQKK